MFKLVLLISLIVAVNCQINLKNYFGNCRKFDKNFEACVEKGLNDLRPHFKTGIPELGIDPFDPFLIKRHPYTRLFPFVNLTAIFHNVTEHGWSNSNFTNLKIDYSRQSVKYRQNLDNKTVAGLYELYGNINNKQVIYRKGSFSFSLYDYQQIFTISRSKLNRRNDLLFTTYPPFQVNCEVGSFKKITINIDNLANGNKELENLINTVTNIAFNSAYRALYSQVNSLINSMLTDVINRNFQYFDFGLIFPN